MGRGAVIAAAAYLYVALACLAALFQLALVLGAPWGALALGGRWQGRLPVLIRLFALLQIGVILGMALVVAARAGITAMAAGPAWLFWPVLVLTAASAIGNITTPSRPERLLWAPVTVVMLIATVLVAFA